MVNEEVIRLVLETKGTETIALLDKSTKDYHASLEALTIQYAKDEITAESFRKQLERLGREYEKQKELLYALDAATKTHSATTTQAGAAMAATQASTVNTGRALQEFGIVANELAQGRIRGLSQSVGRLGAALGMGVGLAGTIGLVVTAGVEVIHMMGGWEAIMDKLGLSAEKTHTQIEALHEKIKKLEENPHKVFMDVVQLEEARNEVERIEKALKTIDELRKSQEHYEAESGKGIKALLASDPEAMKALTKNVVANLTATDPGLAEAYGREAEAKRRLAIDPEELESATFKAIEAYETKEKPAEARGRIAKGADVFIGETIDRAVSGKGEEQAKAQQLLREGFKNAGKQLLVEGLEAVTPASLFEQDVTSEGAEEVEKEMKAAVQKRKAKDKEIDALNQQGITNEIEAAKERDKDAEATKHATQKQNETAKKQREHQAAAMAKTVAATGLGDSALNMATHLMRDQKMSGQNAVEQMSPMISRELRKGGMGAGTAMDVARELAKLATQQAETMISQQQAISVMGANAATLTRQMKQLAEANRKLSRQAAEHHQTALSIGGPGS